VKTAMNNLQFTYLMVWWRHSYSTLHITKFCLQVCYLQFKMTVGHLIKWIKSSDPVAYCFLACIQPNQLFATFAENGPMFAFSNSYW